MGTSWFLAWGIMVPSLEHKNTCAGVYKGLDRE